MTHALLLLTLPLLSGPESIIVSPDTLRHAGRPGTRSEHVLTVRNTGPTPVTVSVSESTFVGGPSAPAQASPPEAFVTAAVDQRGDNLIVGADVLELLYQKRVTIIGTVLDLRVRMAAPDSALGGVFSLDVDQDFGTGSWPVPWGFGPRARDIGAEFEVVVDASGFLSDSLGFGNIPIAVVVRSSDSSVVYIPLFPTLARDSLLTITVPGIPLGPLGINDPDQNLNIGAVFARLVPTAAFPDFIPDLGHGRVGAETGTSWMRSSWGARTIAAGDSASLDVSLLAALPPGAYLSRLRFTAPGLPPAAVTAAMTITAPGHATLSLSRWSVSDTLAPGDSSDHPVTVSNTGDQELLWAILDTSALDWADAFPPGGLLEPGGVTQATIRLRSAALQPGATYAGTLMVATNDPAAPATPFSVSLRVESSSAASGCALPEAFSLAPNYPNPFNPATTLRVEAPRPMSVRLTVWDMLGRPVAEVFRGVIPPGSSLFRWEAGNAPGGAYFFRLESGGVSRTRMGLLIR
ncbi:MAG: hypothetical protein WB626_11015 [Bacteroidota bacterium]